MRKKSIGTGTYLRYDIVAFRMRGKEEGAASTDIAAAEKQMKQKRNNKRRQG